MCQFEINFSKYDINYEGILEKQYFWDDLYILSKSNYSKDESNFEGLLNNKIGIESSMRPLTRIILLYYYYIIWLDKGLKINIRYDRCK